MKKDKIFVYLGDGRKLAAEDLDVVCDKVVVFDPNENNRKIVARLCGEKADFLLTSVELVDEVKTYYDYNIKKFSGFEEVTEDIRALYPSLELLSNYSVSPLLEADVLKFIDKKMDASLFLGYGIPNIDKVSACFSGNFYNSFQKIYTWNEAGSRNYYTKIFREFALADFQGGYTVLCNTKENSDRNELMEKINSLQEENSEIKGMSLKMSADILDLRSRISDEKVENRKLVKLVSKTLLMLEGAAKGMVEDFQDSEHDG